MTIRNPQQTRERLLQSAFREIHAHGFQGMRVDEVLRVSGLKKGAFYHHFGSKTELGYAVLEEQIKPMVEAVWVEPLVTIEDPVRDIPRMIDSLGQRIPPVMREYGCPLNNLAQEMSTQDEGFRDRIVRLLHGWIDAFVAVFERGKHGGYIRQDVNNQAVSRFIIAVLQGCIGVYKVEQSTEQWVACRSQIAAFLATLRR